jgi:hypothetical protein
VRLEVYCAPRRTMGRSGAAGAPESQSCKRIARGLGRPQSALPSLCYQERWYCRSYSNFQPLLSLSVDGPALFNSTSRPVFRAVVPFRSEAVCDSFIARGDPMPPGETKLAFGVLIPLERTLCFSASAPGAFNSFPEAFIIFGWKHSRPCA